jgi:hypothetical protein
VPRWSNDRESTFCFFFVPPTAHRNTTMRQNQLMSRSISNVSSPLFADTCKTSPTRCTWCTTSGDRWASTCWRRPSQRPTPPPWPPCSSESTSCARRPAVSAPSPCRSRRGTRSTDRWVTSDFHISTLLWPALVDFPNQYMKIEQSTRLVFKQEKVNDAILKKWGKHIHINNTKK